MYEVFEQLLQSFGVSAYKFCKDTGIPQSTISTWKKKRNLIIREKTGMSRAEFSRVYGIPVRTMEDWEAGKRKCPDYVTKLLRRVVSEDAESAVKFKLYANNELMKELGACYKELLKIMNRNEFNGREPHNPYPNADIFPTKYFTMILPQAIRIGIPDELNDRIGALMNLVDPEDWAKSMNLPCPAESRMFFNMGMMM